MASWRFYQGLRNEWRWYHLDDAGEVIAESDQAFAELPACMANAADIAGFTGDAYQVHTRQAASDDTIVDEEKSKPAKSAKSDGWNGSPPGSNGPPRQASA